MVLLGLLIGMAVWLLHGPAIGFSLTGDTYQWVQHAHRAMHEPAMILADLDGFFRPSATWLLVLDRLVWGGFDAAGYRTTSLALHALTGLLLGVAGRRLGLEWPAAFAIAAIWVTSPFTAESVFVVACRHELLLLAPWLVLVVVWPRADESWTGGRLATAGLCIVFAAAAKETWVVTPALVAALELERSRSWRSTIVPTVVSAIAVMIYLALYFAIFHSPKSYMELGTHVIAKLPNQLAAFFYLQEPMVDRFSITWAGGLAVCAVVAIVVSCVSWRVPGSLVAACLLLAPNLPTLAIPFMPQRYLTIPYAGFVLLVALWSSELPRRTPGLGRVVRTAGGFIAVLFVVVGGALVRGDIEDYRFMAAAHGRLLNETAEVVDVIDAGEPVIVVRDEQVSPLHELAAAPAGLPKLFFIRAEDPYGLIDAAALFEWVRAEDGVFVEHDRELPAGVPGRVVVHRRGAFLDGGLCEDIAAEATRWRASGRSVRIIRRFDTGT